MAKKECNPAVVELVEYLKSTGTGQAKLSLLTELGYEAFESEKEYLAAVKAALPAGTFAKVAAFIESRKPVAPGAKPVAEPKTVVSDLNVQQALTHIEVMTSVERLKEIQAQDKRVTVLKAVENRLTYLAAEEAKKENK